MFRPILPCMLRCSSSFMGSFFVPSRVLSGLFVAFLDTLRFLPQVNCPLRLQEWTSPHTFLAQPGAHSSFSFFNPSFLLFCWQWWWRGYYCARFAWMEIHGAPLAHHQVRRDVYTHGGAYSSHGFRILSPHPLFHAAPTIHYDEMMVIARTAVCVVLRCVPSIQYSFPIIVSFVLLRSHTTTLYTPLTLTCRSVASCTSLSFFAPLHLTPTVLQYVPFGFSYYSSVSARPPARSPRLAFSATGGSSWMSEGVRLSPRERQTLVVILGGFFLSLP